MLIAELKQGVFVMNSADLTDSGQTLAESIVQHLHSVKRGKRLTDADKRLLRFWLDYAIESYEEQIQPQI